MGIFIFKPCLVFFSYVYSIQIIRDLHKKWAKGPRFALTDADKIDLKAIFKRSFTPSAKAQRLFAINTNLNLSVFNGRMFFQSLNLIK